MKRATRILGSITLVIFVWYLFMDRMTPYTANARVKAVVIEAVPQVSGYVAALAVTNGQIVEEGDLLARIDPRRFQLEVDRARATLQIATQDVGAGSSEVEVARATLISAQVELQNVEVQSERIFELESKGIVAAARGDDMRTQLNAAKTAVERAEADLERARRLLGEEGEDNPNIRAAMAQLGTAQLDLEWAELRAPGRGIVLDLAIGEGTFAHAGSPLVTFVSFDEIWVEAYMTENNIGRIQAGQPAEIALDVYPGRVFEGIVGSITIGVAAGSTSPSGLQRVQNQQAWMRDPQRFPVRIAMQGFEVGSETHRIRRLLNGQATVVVYTTDNRLLTTLAALWLRLNTWLSYAY